MTNNWCHRCKGVNRENLFWVADNKGHSYPVCGNHITEDDNLMVTKVEKELVESFGNLFFAENKLRDTELFHILDWKESPRNLLEKVCKTFNITMKIINIGDADVYTFKRKTGGD